MSWHVSWCLRMFRRRPRRLSRTLSCGRRLPSRESARTRCRRGPCRAGWQARTGGALRCRAWRQTFFPHRTARTGGRLRASRPPRGPCPPAGRLLRRAGASRPRGTILPDSRSADSAGCLPPHVLATPPGSGSMCARRRRAPDRPCSGYPPHAGGASRHGAAVPVAGGARDGHACAGASLSPRTARAYPSAPPPPPQGTGSRLPRGARRPGLILMCCPYSPAVSCLPHRGHSACGH